MQVRSMEPWGQAALSAVLHPAHALCLSLTLPCKLVLLHSKITVGLPCCVSGAWVLFLGVSNRLASVVYT
jgi:hypothetical protein